MRLRLECRTDITPRSSIRLLLLAVFIQAAQDAADNITKDDLSKDAEDFLQDKCVRSSYYDLYGIRNLPSLFREKFNDANIRREIRL